MSALVMGLVWELEETPEFGRAEKFVLMAYADHADSRGRNIYPSINLVMKKTFYEERNVQKITRVLETLGYLVPDGVGPHGTNRWSIPIVTTKEGGAKIAPVQNAGVKNAPEGNAPEGNAPKGNAPEPSVEVNNNQNQNDDEEGARAKKSRVATVYEQEIGALTPLIADAIADAEKDFPAEWIIQAIRIAVERNARNWRFVMAILNDSKAKNVEPNLNTKRTPSQSAKKPVDMSAASAENKDIIRKVAQNVR